MFFSANYLFLSFAHFSIVLLAFFLFIWGRFLNVHLDNQPLLYAWQLFSPCLFLVLNIFIRNFLLVVSSLPCIFSALSPRTAYRIFWAFVCRKCSESKWLSLGIPLLLLDHVLKAKCCLSWVSVSAVSDVLIRAIGLTQAWWHLLIAGWSVTFTIESDGHGSPSLLWEGWMGSHPQLCVASSSPNSCWLHAVPTN